MQFAWKNAKRWLRAQRVLKQHVPKQRIILTNDKFKSKTVLIPIKPHNKSYNSRKINVSCLYRFKRCMNWRFLERAMVYSQACRLSGNPKSLPSINFNLHNSSPFANKRYIKLLALLFEGHMHVEAPP
jgi:hypothetical protein